MRVSSNNRRESDKPVHLITRPIHSDGNHDLIRPQSPRERSTNHMVITRTPVVLRREMHNRIQATRTPVRAYEHFIEPWEALQVSRPHARIPVLSLATMTLCRMTITHTWLP